MKTLLNNKKPPPPPSTTANPATQSSKATAAAKPPEENTLLNDLVSQLQNKMNSKSQSHASSGSKSMQFNNYKTDVDGYSNFGLSLATPSSTAAEDSLISALASQQRANLSSLELGANSGPALLEDKKTSSSSSSSTSSSASEYNKPCTINRYVLPLFFVVVVTGPSYE